VKREYVIDLSATGLHLHHSAAEPIVLRVECVFIISVIDNPTTISLVSICLSLSLSLSLSNALMMCRVDYSIALMTYNSTRTSVMRTSRLSPWPFTLGYALLTAMTWFMVVPRSRTARYSFRVAASQIWNVLPSHLKNINISREQFKSGLKTFVHRSHLWELLFKRRGISSNTNLSMRLWLFAFRPTILQSRIGWSTSQRNLIVPRYRLDSYGRRCFAVAGPSTWNSLPDSLRDPAMSLSISRSHLKTHFLRNIDETYLAH